MNLVKTNFQMKRNLVITDSADKVLGILPVEAGEQDVTARVMEAIKEDLSCNDGDITITMGCVAFDLGSVTEFDVEVKDCEDEDDSPISYEYFLHDKTVY